MVRQFSPFDLSLPRAVSLFADQVVYKKIAKEAKTILTKTTKKTYYTIEDTKSTIEDGGKFAMFPKKKIVNQKLKENKWYINIMEKVSVKNVIRL